LFETCETTHPQHQRPATTRGELWSTPLLPQSFDSDTEISVVSTTYFDYLPFFSNFGTHVDQSRLARPRSKGGLLLDETETDRTARTGIASANSTPAPAGTAPSTSRWGGRADDRDPAELPPGVVER